MQKDAAVSVVLLPCVNNPQLRERKKSEKWNLISFLFREQTDFSEIQNKQNRHTHTQTKKQNKTHKTEYCLSEQIPKSNGFYF